MSFLTDRIPPICLNNQTHGYMVKVPGEWALAEIGRKFDPIQNREVADFKNNNYGVHLYVCATCGFMSMFDSQVK